MIGTAAGCLMRSVLSPRAIAGKGSSSPQTIGPSLQGFRSDTRNSGANRDVPVISRLQISNHSSFHRPWALLIFCEHCLPYEPTALAAPARDPAARLIPVALGLGCFAAFAFSPSFNHIPLPFNGTFQGLAAAPVFSHRPNVMGICSSCLGNRRRDEYDEVRRLGCRSLLLLNELEADRLLPILSRTTRPNISSTTPTACTMAASINST